MPLKIVEVIAAESYADTLRGIATEHEVLDYWWGNVGEDGRQPFRMLVSAETRQAVVDAIQSVLGATADSRILILPVETALPRPQEDEPKDGAYSNTGTTREELYSQVEQGARVDANYLTLVALSTIVATVGLSENNLAVLIGAMVIAPLLGPNLALALATSLGDTALMRQALLATVLGLATALAVSLIIALLIPFDPTGRELMTRTDVGLDSMALALASGAAAALSLTTGLPAVLVGVMVAVALLPPTATLGLMLGSVRRELALGAALLLAVNIVCVNLAAKMVFLIRGVKPRTWWEKQKARQSSTAYIWIWIVSLLLLVVIIYLRQQLIAA